MTNLTKLLPWGLLAAASVTTVLAFSASRSPRQPVKAVQETPVAEVVVVENVTATMPEQPVKKEFAKKEFTIPKNETPQQSGSRAHDESVKAKKPKKDKTKENKAEKKRHAERSVQRSRSRKY